MSRECRETYKLMTQKEEVMEEEYRGRWRVINMAKG